MVFLLTSIVVFLKPFDCEKITIYENLYLFDFLFLHYFGYSPE